eukprot:scaffold80902_cov54-Attheya_sp.AAC.2
MKPAFPQSQDFSPPAGDLPLCAFTAGVIATASAGAIDSPSLKEMRSASADKVKQGKVGTEKRKLSISNNQPHGDH